MPRSSSQSRTTFVELAARLGVPLRLVQCDAPESVLRARIAERSRIRRDASEATFEVLDWQLERMEPCAAQTLLIEVSAAWSDVELSISEKLPQHVREDAPVTVVGGLDGGVDAHGCLKLACVSS